MSIKNIIAIGAALVAAQCFCFAGQKNPDCDPRFSKSERTEPSFKAKQFINMRGNLNNSRAKFEGEKKGRVAFLGGSITEMRGWRNMVQAALKERFPDVKFDFIDAGISSTGSTPGAFRLENDILSKGKIDLLFIENAVNDDTNEFPAKAQIRGMEGEIRRALLKNPDTDIVVLHFIYDPFIELEANKKTPEVIKNHEKVCAHYNVPSINLCREIALRMRDGEFDWKKFGGTHPSPFGHKYYAAAIENLFDSMWGGRSGKISAHGIPKALDKYSYFNGRFVDIKNAKIKSGWKIEDNWKPTPPPENAIGADADTLYSFDGGKKRAIKAHTRSGFVNVPMLQARTKGAEFSLDFEGRAVGIFCVAGPYAGILEYSIDGAPFKKLDTFTHWSGSLYLPWTYIFEDELSEGKHTIVVKMSEQRNKKSFGNECQIRNFIVN